MQKQLNVCLCVVYIIRHTCVPFHITSSAFHRWVNSITVGCTTRPGGCTKSFVGVHHVEFPALCSFMPPVGSLFALSPSIFHFSPLLPSSTNSTPHIGSVSLFPRPPIHHRSLIGAPHLLGAPSVTPPSSATHSLVHSSTFDSFNSTNSTDSFNSTSRHVCRLCFDRRQGQTQVSLCR